MSRCRSCHRALTAATCRLAVLGLLLLLLVGRSPAAIVYSQPSGDTTQPTDDTRWNSTVQWQAVNGGGVIIGPHSFISATHLNPLTGFSVSLTTVNGAGPTTNTQTYTTTASTPIAGSDLTVWTVSGTFPSSSIVPLYSGASGSETGQAMSMVGYGYHIQGPAVTTGSTQNGWLWGGNYGIGGQKNFGTNTVAGVTNDGAAGSSTLVYNFQQLGGTHAIDALGDSGGGVFINVGGVQQLAGIQYSVIEFYSAPNAGAFINGAIYNSAGLYVQTGASTWTPANMVFNPLHTGAITSQWGYATEITPFLSQIQAAIAVPEPSSIALAGLALAGLLTMAVRRRKS